MLDCKNKEKNMEHCNCTYEPCPRKGVCCECIAYHRDMKQLPACYFTDEEESTWDRSVEFFVKKNSK